MVSVSLLQVSVRSTDSCIFAMIMVPVLLLQFSASSTELLLYYCSGQSSASKEWHISENAYPTGYDKVTRSASFSPRDKMLSVPAISFNC